MCESNLQFFQQYFRACYTGVREKKIAKTAHTNQLLIYVFKFVDISPRAEHAYKPSFKLFHQPSCKWKKANIIHVYQCQDNGANI